MAYMCKTEKPVRSRADTPKVPYGIDVVQLNGNFNFEVKIGEQKMQFRHPGRCCLVTGFTANYTR